MISFVVIHSRKLSRIFTAVGRSFGINIVRAVLEACSAMWNIDIKSEFIVAQRNVTKILD
jgi:hypothetical protein